MAKLKNCEIVTNDIINYADNYSDFDFELKVLSLLNHSNYKCQHGGIYEDPITNKSREFDIRAFREYGRLRVRLAVECKNIRANFPLVLHGINRQKHESFHEILVRRIRQSRSKLYSAYDESQDHSQVFRDSPSMSLYPSGKLVGKHPDQVGRHHTEEKLITGDGGVYDKISQAIHSAYDLIKDACNEPDRGKDVASFILPILVVPDESIWIIPYEETGKRNVNPHKVDQISLYVDKTWRVGKETDYTISHLEIITISKLMEWLKNILDEDCNWDFIFSINNYNLESVQPEQGIELTRETLSRSET